jgi:hypothetical protein
MRKYFVTFMASMFSCTAAFAFWPEAADSNFELGVGYRKDKLSWTTQGRVNLGEVPTKLTSKVQWKNLNIWQIDARVKYVTCDDIYFRASGDYGWITHGKATNKDYVEVLSSRVEDSTGSNRSGSYTDGSGYSNYGNEFASFSSKADRGHVYDADLALGYQFRMCDDSLSLTPLVGYAWNGQHLELGGDHSSSYSYSTCEEDSYVTGTKVASRTGSYTDASANDYSDSISGHSHAKYNTRWNGPFIGFDFDYKLMCEWSLFGTYEFHWTRFHAKAHGGNNNSCEQNDFNHRAKSGHGNVASVGLKYDFCDCWTLSLIGEWKYYRTNHGKRRSLVAEEQNGDIKRRCHETIPVKHNTWQSASVTVNVGMLF